MRFRGFVSAAASWFMKPIPVGVRSKILGLVLNAMLCGLSPKDKLKLLFDVDARIYSLEGAASVEYGCGIHSKHRHTGYHDFFVDNILPGEKVLDLGCGNGFLDYDIVTKVSGAAVVGVDSDKSTLDFAVKNYRHPNLSFINADILEYLPGEAFDVVILSNVLEHIQGRVGFLARIRDQIKPKRILLRVPSFERDWRVPLKKELGLDYRLDATHCVEYTLDCLLGELQSAGLKPEALVSRWGEIWCVLKP